MSWLVCSLAFFAAVIGVSMTWGVVTATAPTLRRISAEAESSSSVGINRGRRVAEAGARCLQARAVLGGGDFYARSRRGWSNGACVCGEEDIGGGI